MAVISPRVKTSLERLYDAVDAPKDKILELEVRKMSRTDVEQEIIDLTNELSANIAEIKRRSFNDGVRAALQNNAVLSGTDASAPTPQPTATPQTNVFIESPAAISSVPASMKKTVARESVQSTDEIAAKLALLNDKLDEVDGALASIHEMQFDLQKTQEEVKREFSAKLGEFSALNREASEYVDAVRSVASRMTDVGAKLGDALEENARAREAPVSTDAITEKLGAIERQIDALSEKTDKTASKEMQEENSRLLSSQGIELSSLKGALKKQLKSVRKASKRITRVSRELEEVEGAVKRSGRKTNRSVRRVAEEIGAEKKSAKRFAKKAKVNASQAAESAKAATAKVVKAVKTVKAAKAVKAAAKTVSGKRGTRAKNAVRGKNVKRVKSVKGGKRAAAKRVSKKPKTAVVTTSKEGENVNVTINTA